MSLKIFSNFRNPENDPYFQFLRSKYNDKPISIFYEYFPSREELSLNPANFLMIQEPNEFFGYHDMAIRNSPLFTGIFTWSDKVIGSCPNAIPFTHNGRTLDDNFCFSVRNKEKKFELSFLCGAKNIVEGHKLRHEIYHLGDQINIPKKWFYTLEDYDHENDARPGYANYAKDLSHIPEDVDPIGYGRRILFEESMFNLVIENVNHPNFYNKIGDNFLTKTVPVYWGCENISDWGYDEGGIIRFKDAKDFMNNAVNVLTPEKYKEMEPYLEQNFWTAKNDDLNINTGRYFNEFILANNL
jgi:hypothetical protein